MLSVTNLPEFKDALDRWVDDVEKMAAEAAVGLAKHTFEKILFISPQYSGDFVANWKVSYGTPDYSFAPWPGRKPYPSEDPFKRGDHPAARYAMSNAKWSAPKLGTTIYITNSASHEEPYAWMIENGTIKLRSVNSGATNVMSRAVKVMATRYANITPKELTTLRKF